MKYSISRSFLVVALLLATLAFIANALSDNQGRLSPKVDGSQYIYMQMRTSLGDIVLELDNSKAPITCANFLEYAQSGFYDSTIFHRVISNFMIQGGGFTIDMIKKETRPPIQNEWKNGLKNERGSIAMARLGRQPHSATSQFFINVKDNPNLDRPADGAGYAVFGRVADGMDVVDRIRKVKTGAVKNYRDVPLEPVIIEKVAPLRGEKVEQLKEKVNEKRKALVTPLHQAAKTADLTKLRELIDGGAKIDARDTLQETPLHYAVVSGGFAQVQALIKAGADVNAVNQSHETPLYMAAANGQSDIVDFLLKSGADVDRRDVNLDQTPLFKAVDNGFPIIVEKLITFGSDINRLDKMSQSPLHLAVRKGNEEIIDLLIEAGADVNVRRNNGDTPMHVVALAGNLEVARLLLDAGADVNVSNTEGKTPLHYTVIKDFRQLAQFFLEQGADVNSRDSENKTPLGIALKFQRIELAELLRSRGGVE